MLWAEKESLGLGIQRGRDIVGNNPPSPPPLLCPLLWLLWEPSGRPECKCPDGGTSLGNRAGLLRVLPFLLFLQEVLPGLFALRSWVHRHSCSHMAPPGVVLGAVSTEPADRSLSRSLPASVACVLLEVRPRWSSRPHPGEGSRPPCPHCFPATLGWLEQDWPASLGSGAPALFLVLFAEPPQAWAAHYFSTGG